MTNDEIVEQVRLDRESWRVPLKALTAANVPPASSATSSTDVPLTSALASTVAAPFVFSEGCVFWLGSKGDVPAAATAASITEDVSGSSNGGLSTAQKNFNIHNGQGMTKACLSKRPPTNYAMMGACGLSRPKKANGRRQGMVASTIAAAAASSSSDESTLSCLFAVPFKKGDAIWHTKHQLHGTICKVFDSQTLANGFVILYYQVLVDPGT